MVDRIKKIMEYKNLTPGEFAEQLEINRSNLTHLFSGRNQPSLPFIKKILETFPDISTEWLMMGVGNMLNTELQRPAVANVKNTEQELVPNNEPDLFSNIEERSLDTSLEVVNSTAEKESDDDLVNEEREIESETEHVASHQPTVYPESTPRKRVTSKKSNNSDGNTSRSQICDSRGDKKVKKIVFFYVNNTFEEFYPE